MSYIAANELKHAVEALKASGCNASFIDYLLVRAANVTQGNSGTVIVSGKKLLNNTKQAKFVYGTGNDDSAPYYNPLSGEFLSHRHWTNGPSDTVPRWSARENSPIIAVTDASAKSKTIRIDPFDGKVVCVFFGINDSNRVSLSSMSIWWYRAVNLDDLIPSGALTVWNIVKCFLRDIDLTERQALQVFSSVPSSERSRTIETSESLAAPMTYLPRSPMLIQQSDANEDLKLPRNLIFFGAPGTGKSYQLSRLAHDSFDDSRIRRVTFYPDYTYSQFVGSFKPVTRYANPKDDEPTSKEKPYISYEFVPGPFLSTYISAVQNPGENYLLIVEEINRANPAAVFGDVFQLLDRNRSGRSEYGVAVPKEMEDYLHVFLPEYATGAFINDPTTLLAEQERLANEERRLSLPPNMYIWATMNSADQGVFPMDTAFKRRWDFRYMGIDEGDHKPMDAYDGRSVDDFTVVVGDRRMRWNALRKAINSLMRKAGINEDKLLGPFFLSPSALTDDPATGDSGQSVFVSAFKDKVLLYLYEDAGKMRRDRIFAKDGATYSELCRLFDDEGVGVFDLKEDDLEGVFADSASDDADGE